MSEFGTRMKGACKKIGEVRWLSLLTVLILVVFCACSVEPVFAEEKSVAEKILEILRTNNQITEEQYNELLKQAKAEQASPGKDLQVYWRNGLRFKSRDNQYKIKIGGRIQSDFAFIEADDDLRGAFPSLEGHGTEFRRARIQIAGTMYENVKFKWQYDFANGDVHFKQLWIELRNIPYVGKFRIGHMKEPFSLEEVTCSKYLTFLERALPNTFAPAYNTGVMLHDAEFNKRLTWAVGLFMDTDGQGSSFSDISDYDLTARITGLPWLEENGRKLLHLGFSYSHRFRDNDGRNPIRFRERPEAHLSPVRLVDTGDIMAEDVDLFNPEIVLIYGPLSVQAEYFYASVDSVSGKDPNFDGYYAYVSYFLTGEHRHYIRPSGKFCRLNPNRNFDFGESGWGAWEVGVRYSSIDLDDADIRGGKEDNLTLGLNWYLNPNVRVMLNYVKANVDNSEAAISDGDANIFEARFQMEF